jgi:hypothetical protein
MQLDTIGQFIANLLLVCACGTLSIIQWERIMGPIRLANRTSEVM